MHPIDRMNDAVIEALSQSLPEFVTDVRELTSIPVEYIDGAIIRSKPGENPRLETGVLNESFQWGVEVAGDEITGIAWTETPYAGRLEKQMNRPIFEGLDEEYLPVILTRIAEAASRD